MSASAAAFGGNEFLMFDTPAIGDRTARRRPSPPGDSGGFVVNPF